jgi:phosphoglycolate phosphatase
MRRCRTRSVLFDLDGTLTDPADGIVGCIQHALVSLGAALPPASQLTRYIGPPLRESFAILLGHPGDAAVEEAVGRYRERFEVRGMYENRVYPGIREVLDRIAGMGWQAYVATSKPTPYATRILDHFGLSDSFAVIHGSEMNGRLTRKQDLLAHVLAVESILPGEAVMVGDRAEDVLGARENNVASIGVTYGFGTRQELNEAGATWICDDPGALFEVLREHYGEVPS